MDVINTPHVTLPNIDNFQNIRNSQKSSGDVGEEDMGAGAVDENDVERIPSDSPEAHPDPCPDATYTLRPKRIPVPSQKVVLNEKWSDTKMWAQRAIAHTKCNKTLESERLYFRQAIVNHEDLSHHDFEPDFDLAAAVQQITDMRCLGLRIYGSRKRTIERRCKAGYRNGRY